MHIASLQVDGFGQFTQHDPIALAPGLVVVHGPNEAGKTTLRQFVRWALFGFQRADRDRDRWTNRLGQLRGELTLVSGSSRVKVVRRDRAVETHVGSRVTPGEDGLAGLLRGTDRALYDAVFAFDLFDLQQLGALSGERVQNLLALGAILGGGRHPADLLKTFDDEAAQYWRPRAAGVQIRRAEDELRAINADLTRARKRAATWEVRTAELAHAEARLAELGRDHDRLRGERHHLARLRAAWPVWSRRLGLVAALESLGDEPELTAAIRERVESSWSALIAARDGRQHAEEQLRVAQVALEQVAVDDAVLAEHAVVEALADQLAVVAGASEALPELELDSRRAREEARARLDQVAPGFTEERLAQVVLDAATVAEARQHAVDTASLVETAPAELTAARVHCEAVAREREITSRELAALGRTPLEDEEPALRRLAATADESAERRAERGRLEAESAAREAEVTRLAAELVRDPATVGLVERAIGEGEVEEAGAWAQRWRDAVAQRAERVRSLEAHRAATRRALEVAQAALAQAEALPGAEAPSRQETATIEAAWPDARAALTQAAESARELDDLALARRTLLESVAPGADEAQLRRVDRSAAAEGRRRGASEQVAEARREEEALRSQADGLASGSTDPDPGAVDAHDLERARSQRDLAVGAKAALDTLEASLGRGATPAPERGEALTRWLGVGLLVVVALIAFALAQLILGAAALGGAVVVAVVAVAARARRSGSAVMPDIEPARRALAAAARAAGLGEGAGRSEIEVAITRRDDTLRCAEQAIERAAALEAAQRRRDEAARAFSRAAAATSAAREQLAAVLRATGLPEEADRELVRAWVESAAALARLDQAADAATRARDDANARVRAFAAVLARHVGETPTTAATLEAAVASVVARRQEADRREEACRRAVAAREAADRADGATADELSRAVAKPEVPPELSAGWRAWAGAVGVAAPAPTPACVTGLKSAERLTTARRVLAAVRTRLDAVAPAVDAHEREVARLAEVAGTEATLGALQAALAELQTRRAARAERERQLPGLDARWRAAEAALERAERRSRALAQALAAWEVWSARVEAPDELAPAHAEAWVQTLVAAREALARRSEAVDRLALASETVGLFVDRVGALAARLGVRVDATPAWALGFVRDKRAALAEAQGESVKRRERQGQVREGEALVADRVGACEAAEARWREEARAAGCADHAEWRGRLERAAQRAELDVERARLDAELRGQLGAAWAPVGPGEASAAVVELETGDIARWEAREEALDAALDEVSAEREELEVARGDLRSELKALADSAEVAELANAREAAAAALEEARREWWRLCIARRILRDTFERFRRERQPEVLKRAAAWFVSATAGAYSGVEVDDGANGLAFVAIGRDGARHPADLLSTGATGLLYLCLRLALAVDQAEQTARLPLLLDDVLSHFDPERAMSAARLLAQVAQEVAGLQLVLFTCRPETVQCARAAAANVTVVDLPRWAGDGAPRGRQLGRVTSTSRASQAPSASVARAPTPSAPAAEVPLAEAIALLGETAEGLARADFFAHLHLDDGGWRALREALEQHPEVVVEGERRGRRYLLSA